MQRSPSIVQIWRQTIGRLFILRLAVIAFAHAPAADVADVFFPPIQAPAPMPVPCDGIPATQDLSDSEFAQADHPEIDAVTGGGGLTSVAVVVVAVVLLFVLAVMVAIP